ncbi:hypothetical protein LSH36_890g00010 [Paralvinella palmiformis]|uniref:C-type lectin domain-containing protein n=1 Tax=Paralvinella palmiformis TaxID=53620 RepID=A0AAD9IYD3_9ANNE|nr:hypothetical protein LSH36_890g00010 [Paralvinella palmiformis]
MFTLLLFVSVSCISTVLASAPLAGYCDGPTSDNCYLIYEQDNNNKSWDQADEACRKLNQRLATVPDENIQEIMKMLAGVGDGEAWVSGKGVIGPWKDITSKQLVNGAITDSEDPNKRCVVLQTDTSSLVKTQIIAVGCKPETGRMVVCQYPQTATNECLIGSKLSSTCFMVYKDTFLTLDDGQQFCQNISSTVTNSSTPPFLAYIDVDDSSFINFVFYNFKNKSLSILRITNSGLGFNVTSSGHGRQTPPIFQ